MTAADSPLQRWEAQATLFDGVCRLASGSDWDRPTPCAGWVARDVVAHLTSWVPAVLANAQVGAPAERDTASAEADDPATDWSRFRAWISSLLSDPDVAQRRFDVGPPGVMAVEEAVDRLVTPDVMFHAWDLGAALGVDVAFDEGLCEQALEGMRPIGDILRSSGHFGPEVDVDSTRRAQDRLLGFVGRDPDWLDSHDRRSSPGPVGDV